MRLRIWRVAALGVAAASAAAMVLSAQAPVDETQVTFRLYAGGREIGRETSTVSASAAGRTIQSVIAFKDRGVDVRLTASVDADLAWEPRRLLLQGQPFAGAAVDLDVTVAGTRATVSDRGASRTIEIGDGLFFPVDGALPAALQESLIAYWRSHGRPDSLPSAPGAPIRISVRADEQADVAGRTISLQRLSIDGPVWGRQTAWIEPGGNLSALVTWVDGVPVQAVRDGFESRLTRFVERALRDRIEDLEKLTVAPDHADGVVLSGATVVPSGGRATIPDAVVVVRNGRIAAVGAASKVKAPEDLPRVDATGMTIIPGLWDTDARLSQIELGPLYLAAGITTIRNAGPDTELAAALRAAIADRAHAFLGPRFIPSGVVESVEAGVGAARAGTIDEARQAARKYRNDGFRRLDLSSSLAPAVFHAAAAEGRRLGMGISGSLPAGVTVAAAVESGVDVLVGALGAGDAASWVPLLVKQQVALAPELAAATEIVLRPNELPLALARRFAVVNRAKTDADRAALLAQVRSARDGRVSVVGGTGSGVPVSGLWREVELFVEAGMTPAEALQAVTSVSARVMKTEDAGTVEAGKRADLVVLTGNPLENVANLRTVKWVVANGRLYDSAKLRALVN